jgi:parallel beta-helix repeat protein
MIITAIVAAVLAVQPQTSPTPPTVRVVTDDTKIDRSCVVSIAPDYFICDANGDGVLHIVADGITVEFAPGTILRGEEAGAAGNTLAGTGIRIQGKRDVVLKGCRVSGYKVGVRAESCPGLVIEGGEWQDNYRQRLKSTAQAEDGSDWLYPHNNDGGEWVRDHGAAIAIKNATEVTVRGVKVRNGQNGIVLDRVNDSKIYDNDCSFLSGWGLAMWRSNRNTISRNALDFCIRGYSHGVYNRGQDSAGLLMFEQCSENVIVENSITHGGDGIFGFAGREAIGEAPAPGPDFDYKGRGCSKNLFAGNDLSYAAAHGLEMTFSHGNTVFENRFVGNAICGIWGGYSTSMLISGNEFRDNGEMAYGQERGGVNIEHGSRNQIVRNTFNGNKCGVHLWWDDDGALLTKPGVVANGSDVVDNFIAENGFVSDAIALHLRDTSKTGQHVRGTVFANNKVRIGKDIETDEGIHVEAIGPQVAFDLPLFGAPGETRPHGNRPALAGRENIIITEWGPWDHESPLVRAMVTTGGTHRYEIRKLPGDATFSVSAQGETPAGQRWEAGSSDARVLVLEAPKAGVIPYTLAVRAKGFEREFAGALVKADWDVTAFAWEGSVNPPLPPVNLEAWRRLAFGPDVVKARVGSLSFKFGGRGPKGIKDVPEFAASNLGASLYGVVARTSLPLTAGKWRITTVSDDGIRVMADDAVIIENWTHHGPATDQGELMVPNAKTVAIVVEYFQIGGHAELDFKIDRVP